MSFRAYSGRSGVQQLMCSRHVFLRGWLGDWSGGALATWFHEGKDEPRIPA